MSDLSIKQDEIQGNILKPFGRTNAAYLFVQFDDDPARVRPALSSLLAEYVSSAAKQEEITRKWKASQGSKIPLSSRIASYAPSETQVRGELDPHRGSEGVGMFGLSATGYQRLGLANAFPSGEGLGVSLFKAGLQSSPYAEVDDEDWDTEFKEQEIDAFLLLADDDRSRLTGAVVAATAAINQIGKVVKKECVYRRVSKSGDEENALGFRDGIATPPEPGVVLTEEPGAEETNPRFGCFALLMKMEQDVAAFQGACDQLAKLAVEDPEKVQALAVGRNKNGQSLLGEGVALSPTAFANASAAQCPFHAHVRNMNPRKTDEDGETRQIIRRGLSYGPNPLDVGPTTVAAEQPQKSGLFFLSFQRSLLDVYFLIQRALWLRDPLLSRKSRWTEDVSPDTGGVDLTSGPGQLWNFKGTNGGPGKTICYPIADVTTIRGGEYFYIPSMPFIRELGGPGDSKRDQSARSPSARTVPPHSKTGRKAPAAK